MSVKFQQDTTIRNGPLPNAQFPNAQFPNAPMLDAQMPNAQMPNAQMPNAQMPNAQMPNVPVTGDQHQGLVHRIGEAVTGGDTHTGYLAAYLAQLQKNPLRTKMLTSGSLAALQEVLASWLARDRSKNGHYFSSRVPKMALYGAFVSAPLGHFLIKILQRMFAKRTSLTAKILQILVSNLIVSPIQNVVYLASMAVIAGARTFHQIRATVRAGFIPVMRVSWIASPIALAFAQQFLPEQAWVPFFNTVGFAIGVYVNTYTKKKRLAALRHMSQRRDDGYGRPEY